MKRVLLLAISLLTIHPLVHARKEPPAGKTVAQPAEEIHWITSIDELQAKMAEQPRKVLVDMYTGWCGWCKKMDAETYTNPSLVKYVNNNFYAVKLDAERKDTINFQGKQFFFAPEYRTNGFALELLKDMLSKGGQLSYPQTVFLMENFQNPVPIPGYRTVAEMETFLTYFGDNVFRRQAFDQYSKTFVSRWSKGQPQGGEPAPGH
jgi:thioredoxin-related protein